MDNIDYMEATNRAEANQAKFPDATTSTTSTTTSSTTTRIFEKNIHAQRNETTRRVEKEVYRILSWDDPIRSGVIFLIIVGSIVLTNSYSLLQIGALFLSIAISLNLVYVSWSKFYQSVITDTTPVHPHFNMLSNDHENLLNKDKAIHFGSLGIDVAETISRALTRIILVEDTMTSFKWLCIFFIIYKLSSYFSSRTIILSIIISAFIVPRLYVSNKDIVDARIQQGQAIMNTQLKSAQEFADSKFVHIKDQIQHYIHKKKKATVAAAATTTGGEQQQQKPSKKID